MNKLENDNKSDFDTWFEKHIILVIGIVMMLAMMAMMFMMLIAIKKITILQSMNQFRSALNDGAKYIEYIHMVSPRNYILW
ncbi:MAG: hypothetical protein K5663_07285 [Clostridiales bacterium]|nr:hypothetical protein [Clostridiales bacterium]